MLRWVGPLLVLVTAARVHAQSLDVQECAEPLGSALPAVIKLEVEVLLRERGATRSPPDRVVVRCSGDRITIEVTRDEERRATRLDLSALAPEHRARAVALATAELVDALSPRPSGDPTTPAPVEAKRAPTRLEPEAPDLAPEPTHSFVFPRPTLGAGVLAERAGAPAIWLLGVRVSLDYPLGHLLVPSVSLDGALGDARVASARVSVETLSAAAHVYLGAAAGSLRLLAGPGARLGWARLTGRPSSGSELEAASHSGSWAGPELRARVATAPESPGSAAFALEVAAGYAARPVRGLVDGADPAFALDTTWLSASAQGGFAF